MCERTHRWENYGLAGTLWCALVSDGADNAESCNDQCNEIGIAAVSVCVCVGVVRHHMSDMATVTRSPRRQTPSDSLRLGYWNRETMSLRMGYWNQEVHTLSAMVVACRRCVMMLAWLSAWLWAVCGAVGVLVGVAVGNVAIGS
jgi:hypothetical protein